MFPHFVLCSTVVIGLILLYVILICDHQEKHNKDELTRGAGGRIKEVEDNRFRAAEEDMVTARKQEESIADKVSI